ncbi:MAG: hypothetical protein KKF89_05670 [Nanoarchaeota archaeon]|nr:hypothetical protein [Nanoarchaeota archaeon]MBU1855185.1 hypothetical protein [Nanoarchaeota archaeon]
MKTTMERQILSKNWIWFWSGNWPLLDNVYEVSPECQENFKRITGVYPRYSACFFKEGILTVFHSQEEYDRMEKQFLKNFERDPKFILKSLANYDKRTRKDLKELSKIRKINFSKLQSVEITNVYIKSIKHFIFNSTYDHYCWYLEKYFIPILENYLKRRLKELGEEEKLSEYLILFVTPQKKSRVYNERKDFFSIINKIKTNKAVNVDKLIKDHVRKYCYLSVLVNNPPTTKEDTWKEIKTYLENNEAFRIESVRLGDIFEKETKKKVNKLLKKLKPNKRIKLLIEGLRETAYIRTEDNAVMGLSTFLIMPMQNEIAKRLGLTYYELKELLPEEIIYYLKNNLQVPRKLIKDKLKASFYFVHEKNRYIFQGKEAEKYYKLLDKKTKTKYVKELKGTPASIGRTVGTAFVAKSSSTLKEFEKGGILVAPATSADFVPVMRKASAIITEMGGITSHAGIISREFNVPCLVGVKNATDIIKTGDKIEVDANKGIIKILDS